MVSRHRLGNTSLETAVLDALLISPSESMASGCH
jgi:hypothetical protein